MWKGNFICCGQCYLNFDRFLIRFQKGLLVSNIGGSGLVTKSCLTLATPRTVKCQAPLSLGFPEYWRRLPFPSPGSGEGILIFLDQGSNLSILHWRQILHHPSHQRSPSVKYYADAKLRLFLSLLKRQNFLSI